MGAAIGVGLSHRLDESPAEPVIVVTQRANLASRRLAERLGFVAVGHFEEFGADQVLLSAEVASFRGQRTRSS